MSFVPPKVILIKSDDNVMEYSKTLKTKTEINYEYLITKSLTKEGTTVLFSEKELERLLSYSFEII